MKEFFIENGSGQNSMMRLIAFITVIIGLMIAIMIVVYGMLKGNEGIEVIKELIYLCFGVIGFGFGGKTIQKLTENKSRNSERGDK